MTDSPHSYNSIVETIGNTPIIKLSTFSEFEGNYFVKVESFNPGCSSKDRIAITIIENAEKDGLIKPGGTIVEATSGNTGLGLALVGITKGYKVILVMPDKMSPEKMNLVKAMGCEVIVCPTEVMPEDPRSYYSISKKIAETTEGAFYANQYHNTANPEAHYKTTGPEIWKQTEGRITHFICGIGTGGTISGTAKFLKEKNPLVKIIGVDPLGSILAHFHKYRNTDTEAKSYKVEGVGEDIIPSNVHFDLIDEIVTINDKEAFEWTRKLACEEGILSGGSSGLAVAGAMKYFSDRPVDSNTVAVILLPDTGERYLGKIFSDAWLRSNGFIPSATNIKEILTAKSANLPPIIELGVNATISDAFQLIQKFKINQILINLSDNKQQFLLKPTIYDAMILKTALSTPLSEFELKDVYYIDLNTDIDTVTEVILKYGPLVVKEKDVNIGIITKHDIVNNTNFT